MVSGGKMSKKGLQRMCLFFYNCEVLGLVFKSYCADNYLCPDHELMVVFIIRV